MTRTLRASRVDRAQYAPASEAEDLSRMLDPAYTKRAASASPKSIASALHPTVYVDHAGDMHDPDFRPFPVLPTKAPLTPPPTDGARRPSWDALFDVQPHLTSPPPSAHEPEDAHHRCFFKRRSPPPSDAGSRRPSFEEEYIYDDDEDDDPSFPHTPEPDSGSTKQHIELRYIFSLRHLVMHADSPRSGKEALKYQVQALSLSVQLGVFRAKRRWRERKHSHQPT
jgi:hypothetical protein